ncbi:helix-turn-helix domain-containing protein [Neoroseomonas soli]|uniref:Helix-turn-helix domain-containing protein n=1 Tax=Neoroseomonas soli TaxID=1081025 RepID=A0A9X9X0M1_9PROT|nr:helix-turn-helix domain-containing protein [Neoroseomonas soli]MBR0672950.1 helix-turn-helix domain-containing protein [Neoroseomonas soli]
MTSSHFSTLATPPCRQFEAWCGWFDPVFDVAPPTDGLSAGFEGEITVWSLGQAAIGRVRAPRLHALRGAHNIRREPVDHWNVVVGGRDTRLTRAGGAVTIPARTPFVVSLGEVMESEREADERLQLYLPRDHFACLAPILDRARGVPLNGAAGRLLAGYLHLLEHSLPELPPEDLPRLAEAIRAMVGACISPAVAGSELAAAQMGATQLEQVRQAIRRRLSSATLNAAALCREVGMSRSQLYRLLEGEGGVARYIQRLRLQASYTALSDVGDTRSVAVIAESCGFYDPSTFSRSFRREFGISPSDMRIASRAGAAPAAVFGPVMEAETRTLRSCLHGI